MVIISDYVSRMVKCGMDPNEAMQIAAELFAAGAASADFRSSAAIKQQRYRDRKRNETVTNRNVVTPIETVTNVTESVTNRNNVTHEKSVSLSISKKEEDKKERKRERGTQLPPDWRPGERAWQDAVERLGAERATVELEAFANHAADKGRISKSWDAAFRNWVSRAIVYSSRASPAKPLTEFQRRRNQTVDILNDLDQYASGSSRQENTRILPGNSSLRPGDICGGPGDDLVALPFRGSVASS